MSGIHLNTRSLRKAYYAFLLARRGGLGIFLRQLWSRVYSKTSYVWLAKDLDTGTSLHSPRMRYFLQSATPGAFRKLLQGLNGESSQDIFEILRRVSFYEKGFDRCYLALTDLGEVCHMSWLLSASHNDLIRTQYPPRMRELEEGEVLQENVFTFRRYRRKGIMTSIILDLANMARNLGFRRVLAYVDIENRASLRAFHRAGFRSYDGEEEIRRFFTIRRRKALSWQNWPGIERIT
jgi:GNAT superfamily N-acetyltransferase